MRSCEFLAFIMLATLILISAIWRAAGALAARIELMLRNRSMMSRRRAGATNCALTRTSAWVAINGKEHSEES